MFTLLAIIAVLGLRKLGVNIPYFDNAIYAAKMKFAEMKFQKTQKVLSQTITPIARPIKTAYKSVKTVTPVRMSSPYTSWKMKI